MNGYRAKQLCQADYERLCKDAPKLGECVKAHDAELSKECKAALVKGSKQQKADEKAADKAPDKAGEKTPRRPPTSREVSQESLQEEVSPPRRAAGGRRVRVNTTG
jgi:hypothetical protein